MMSDLEIIDAIMLTAVIAMLYLIRSLLHKSALNDVRAIGASSRETPRPRYAFLVEALELLLAGVFLMVGAAKLAGRQDMVALFRDIGFGQWLRYLTGTMEVLGGTLLVIPPLSVLSALMLGGVMIAATLIELFVLHRPPVAAVACLSGHTFVAWARISNRSSSPLLLDRNASPRFARHDPIRSRWRFDRLRHRVRHSVSIARRRPEASTIGRRRSEEARRTAAVRRR